MRNTLATSLLTIIFSIPAPIIIALALNEIRIKRFKQVGTDSIIFAVLYFVGCCCKYIYNALSQDGVINAICLKLHLIDEPIQYFQNGKYFWWIIAIANTWKGMGYNSIIIFCLQYRE